MGFTLAERLRRLPPYLFAELDRLRDEVAAKGVDIIDLGVGDPDQPTPAHVIEALCEAARDPATHRYPAYSGMRAFREAAASWMKTRFGLELDPDREIITLIGSKEGIAHFPLAFVDPGDVVLVPSPAYPVYRGSTILAGGEPVELALREENGFLPVLEDIDPQLLKRAKLLVINYPNNPTAATATVEFFSQVVDFAREHGLIVVSDAAYVEMGLDGYRPPSFLEAPGAMDVGIEFHSLSKTYNMTGWRIGFAAGNAELIAGLGKVKSQIDSGAFDAIQLAGVAALTGPQEPVEEMRKIYASRRDVLVKGLESLGLRPCPTRATFYVWCRVPEGTDSRSFASRLLTEAGIVATPGVGFGEAGEGYVRFALTVGEQRLSEALQRMQQLSW